MLCPHYSACQSFIVNVKDSKAFLSTLHDSCHVYLMLVKLYTGFKSVEGFNSIYSDYHIFLYCRLTRIFLRGHVSFFLADQGS